MKKLIAAAVAASLTSVAFADISITGSTKINYKAKDSDDNTTSNSTVTEHNLDIVGKHGDSSVVFGLATDAGGAGNNYPVVENMYMTTKVGDVSIKAGEWDNGDNYIRTSAYGTNKLHANTTIGPVNINAAAGHGTDDEEFAFTTDLGGVTVKYVTQAKDEMIGLTGAFGGINFNYLLDDNDGANTDKSSLELSTTVNDMGIKVVQIDADSSALVAGDSWAGDFEDTSGTWALDNGMDVTAVELSTNLAGNAVKFQHTSVDKDTASSSKDITRNRVIVTRPLASGATFELVYTSADEDATAATSYDELDLELSVKF
jgi:hypothetical protein